MNNKKILNKTFYPLMVLGLSVIAGVSFFLITLNPIKELETRIIQILEANPNFKERVNEVSQQIMDVYSNNKTNSANWPGDINWINFFKDLIDIIYGFYGQLSLDQIAAISHLFIAIFILLCLTSVIAVIYGDFLLNYLKLEEKYPRLGRFIAIRRKFQHFYLFVNLFLIIAILLYVIYVDLSVLIY